MHQTVLIWGEPSQLVFLGGRFILYLPIIKYCKLLTLAKVTKKTIKVTHAVSTHLKNQGLTRKCCSRTFLKQREATQKYFVELVC